LYRREDGHFLWVTLYDVVGVAALLCSALLYKPPTIIPITHVPAAFGPAKAEVGLSLTTMSDYDFRPGGSLKLKGVAEGGVVKK
jgi:hypothetical protein